MRIITNILLLSCLLLPTLGIKSPLVLVMIYVFIMGFGFGGGLTTLTIVVQASVGYSKRGAATASNSLVRTLGQTIGVSIFGSIFNLNIVKYFNDLGIKGIKPNNLYSTSSLIKGISPEHVKVSLNSALHVVFIVFILLIVFCIALTIMLPNKLKEEIT